MTPTASKPEITRLRDLTTHQKKSGLAAWLGWLFDGLDMHIYTLVATPFVALLLMKDGLAASPGEVDTKASIIQAAFLVGWALGGGVFGWIGDRLGRSRTLVLTILFYAGFTGLSYFCTEWWHLLICRFLSALGIGGEWAVGASLLSETWPKKWRPWIAATLQTAVNVGILLACLAGELLKHDESHRSIFLVGIIPALLTLWIRKAVPETEEWEEARRTSKPPRIRELFGPQVAGVTWRVLVICAVSLTAHWAFMFWQQSLIRSLPEVKNLSGPDQTNAVVVALMYIMIGSICGNYLAGALAKLMGYRRAITLMLLTYAICMLAAFSQEWTHSQLLWWYAVIGVCQGVFGLFTMCLPPLFPTLLRTTGSGFCYNIGRIVAAAGTVLFKLYAPVGDYRMALFYAGLLFIPASAVALLLPEEKEGV
ncbi:putative MFS family arabinose efflux permease [Prosthecobacter fusiformis]|uniref:Putative MFS family arabinose efflux permease n=1 Tax=Prosthecobacter fusiformis TaxID=48464 RepID=A0A4R7RJ05_9BACT|nr:MFS transporter [Prosthecobacter fusiformis]TDU64041.1 putative MFS family arabinose efflux permease [Prosthecobacter fusiformis]